MPNPFAESLFSEYWSIEKPDIEMGANMDVRLDMNADRDVNLDVVKEEEEIKMKKKDKK